MATSRVGFMRRTQTVTISGAKNSAVTQKENSKVVGLPVQGKTYGATTDGFGKRKRTFGADHSNVGRISNDPKRIKTATLTSTSSMGPFIEVTNMKDVRPTATVAPTVNKTRKPPTPKKVKTFPRTQAKSRLPLPNASKPSEKASSFHMKEMKDEIEIIGKDVPKGVEDIDSNDNSVLNCKVFANDIVNYCRNQELRWKIPQSYIEKCPLKSNTRGILIDWIIQVQHHLKLDQQTLHLTVSMIDQYLCRSNIALGKVQLLGIACLFVASKFEERFAPSISNLIHLTDNSYTYHEVIRMELLVLNVLQFNLSCPTSMVFLDRGLKVVDSRKDKVEYTSRYFLDLALPHFRMLQYSASLKAASAVYLSSLVLRDEGKTSLAVCKKSLAFYLGQSTSAIDDCTRAMAKLLVETNRFKGAQEKYTHRHYLSVSKMDCLSSPKLKEIAQAV